MSLGEPQPANIEAFYGVDVLGEDVEEYPLSHGVLAKRVAFFDDIKQALDLGEIANLNINESLELSGFDVDRIFREQLIVASANPEDQLKDYTYELWFSDLQKIAEVSGRMEGKGLQIIRYSKFRLKPETREAIAAIHNISAIIG